MLDTFISLLKENWNTFSHAPLAFLISLLAGGGLGWFLRGGNNANKIQSFEDTSKSLEARNKLLEAQNKNKDSDLQHRDELVKELKGELRKFQRSTKGLEGKIDELFSETQIKLADKIREIDTFKKEISGLQKEIDELKTPKLHLVYRPHIGSYMATSGEGPFCPHCWLSGRKMSVLSHTPLPSDKLKGDLECNECRWKKTIV